MPEPILKYVTQKPRTLLRNC